MCDTSSFGIGAALLQSHKRTNKMNLISANSRLFTKAELRLSTLMRECTAIIYAQNNNSQINSRLTPATNIKIGTYGLIPNFTTQKRFSKKIQPLRKGPYQIVDKYTDVIDKLTDLNRKEIFQHRNNLSHFYPKEYALRELTQLYSFTGLKVIQNNSKQNQNQSTDMHPIQKQLDKKDKELPEQISKNVDNKNRKKNRKLEVKIIPQDQKEISPHRQSSRLRNQPRKDYKTFIPQSKILKKVEFQKPR